MTPDDERVPLEPIGPDDDPWDHAPLVDNRD